MRTPHSHNFQSEESVPQYVRFTASLKTGHAHSAETFADIHRIPRLLTVQFSRKIQVTYMYHTCITTVRLGYVPPHPHSGVEPAEGNKTGGPVGSRNTSLISPVAGSCNTHTHTNTHTCLLCLRTSTSSHYFKVQLLLTLSSHTCILPHPITHTYTARLPSENSRTVFERLPPFDGIRA